MTKITIQSSRFWLKIIGLKSHPWGFHFTFHEALSLFLDIHQYIANYEYACQTTSEGRYKISTRNGTLNLIIKEEEDGNVVEDEWKKFFLVFATIMQRFYKENKSWMVKMMEQSGDKIKQVSS